MRVPMWRHPHTITAVRMLCALGILWVEPMSLAFLDIHGIAACSDAIDGAVARRMGVQSTAGAMLDSIADVVYLAALLIALVPYMNWPVWIILWLAAITVLRLSTLVAGVIRWRQLVPLHTWANKATGMLVMATPFLLVSMRAEWVIAVVAAAATIVSLEEAAIVVTASAPNRDVTSIFA